MDRGSQRWLLARRFRAALRAAPDGPRVRVSGGQHRGPAADADLAAALDPPFHRAAQGAPVFGFGTYEPIETSNARIFATIRRFEDDLVLCVHNLARSAQAVELDLSPYAGRYPVELFGRSRFPQIGELSYLLTLAPRGFYWFQLVEEGEEAIG